MSSKWIAFNAFSPSCELQVYSCTVHPISPTFYHTVYAYIYVPILSSLALYMPSVHSSLYCYSICHLYSLFSGTLCAIHILLSSLVFYMPPLFSPLYLYSTCHPPIQHSFASLSFIFFGSVYSSPQKYINWTSCDISSLTNKQKNKIFF